MWNKLKEQSTWTGVGIAGLTIFQATGSLKATGLALLAALLKVILPDAPKA